MAKRKLKLLAQRLFSTMLSLLLHARRMPLFSSSSTSVGKPTTTTTNPPVVVLRDGYPPVPSPTEDEHSTETSLVVDVDTALLLGSTTTTSSSSSGGGVDLYFPYFMLVALEAGGFLRGMVLLLLYPLLRLVDDLVGGVATTTRSVSVMAAVAFCGLRASRFRSGRAVLPKWFMENVAAEAFHQAMAVGSRRRRVVCVSGMPRVMVEGFLKEYLGADVVVGKEMKTLWGFYTGLMEQQDDQKLMDMEKKVDNDVVGFSGSPEFLKHPLARCCKEVYVVRPDEKRKWHPLPRDKYPNPIVFHDGRLAFLPTFSATVAMFAWLPLGIPLGAARLVVALTIPYKYSTPILAFTGMSWRLKGPRPPLHPTSGQLFACNHRTLIDPVYVSVALDRPVRAVSYSLSRLSELISPIGRTVRLTRDRAGDGAAMARLLAGGDLVVVCPEGTTCREPYLLRFSPLFAELADDVVPVGVAVETSMFYATTAGGLKCFDPLYYMVNPRMCYTVQFLDKVDTSSVRGGDKPSTDVANLVQKKMGDALGYGCTMLTRKDKYLMLAGNDGIVVANNKAAAVATDSAAGKKKKNN